MGILGGALIGLLLGRDQRESVLGSLKTYFLEAGGESGGTLGIIISIFIHNIAIALFMMGAALWVRFLPHFIIGINGLVIGLVATILGHSRGIGRVIAILAPHGVFELPAILFAGALSILAGSWKRETSGTSLRALEAKRVARAFWLVAGFLAIAATIEGIAIGGLALARVNPERPLMPDTPQNDWIFVKDPEKFGRAGTTGEPIRIAPRSTEAEDAMLQGVNGKIVGISVQVRFEGDRNTTASIHFEEGNRLAVMSRKGAWFMVDRLVGGDWKVEHQIPCEQADKHVLTLLQMDREYVFGVDGHEVLRCPAKEAELKGLGLQACYGPVTFENIRLMIRDRDR